MAIFSRSTIKGWFVTRAKPTQTQYSNLIDSCFNLNDDQLPQSQVIGLTAALNNIYAQLAVINTGVPISNSETFVVTGDFQKLFTTGKTLDSILIDPPGAGMFSINIGTSFGTNDVEDSFTIDGQAPETFNYTKRFKTDTTWYFSGVPASSTITIYYKS